MKILLVHNAYQHRGGEDAVVEAEAELLRQRGHAVIEYWRHNRDIVEAGLRTAVDTLWSARTVREVKALIRAERPDVLHAHNTFPLVSPSLYWAAADSRLAVVQTLHNFRLICPQAMLLRNGKVCEDCVGTAPLAAVRHGCYQQSRSKSAAVSTMLVLHRGLGTWRNKVHRYIALNGFCRDKFLAGGLPADRVVVKPNFVPDLDLPPVPRAGLLFVGRLSHEKGLRVLAAASASMAPGSVGVVGSGPNADSLAGIPAFRMHGVLAPEHVRAEMSASVALVFPSIWYETFGLVIVEAFAAGTPVIASRLGVVPDLVRDGETGLLVEPGNAEDLAQKMRWALAHPAEMAQMGSQARRLYESRFNANSSYQRTMEIYAEAQSLSQAG